LVIPAIQVQVHTPTEIVNMVYRILTNALSNC